MLDTKCPLDVEFRVVQPDGSIRWVVCRGIVTCDAGGIPVQVNGVNVDITERKQAEAAVLEHDQQIESMVDAIDQLAWIANADGWIFWYNQRWYEYTGTTPEQMEGWGWESVHDPAFLPEVLEKWTACIRTGVLFDMVFPLKGADGVFRSFLTRVHPVRDREGKIVRWFGTNSDIHDQKTAEQRLEAEILSRTEQLRSSLLEKETLLKEVHHRVKNNLQVISSLLKMQGESLKDPGAATALKDSQQRVLSMALIHERLYGNRQMNEIDFAEYTQTLVNELFYSYTQSDRISSRFKTSRVLLNIDQAIPCGLILNELVSNALKYAYPVGNGEVTIELKERPSGSVVLSVSHTGVGLPDAFNWKDSKSLGLTIVDILARQLGGTLSVQKQGGAAFVVEFPKEAKGTKHVSAA